MQEMLSQGKDQKESIPAVLMLQGSTQGHRKMKCLAWVTEYDKGRNKAHLP